MTKSLRTCCAASRFSNSKIRDLVKGEPTFSRAMLQKRVASPFLSDESPILYTAAYHRQQAAEKALKTFLHLHDIPFQKTHLLLPLVGPCIEINSDFE